MTKEEIKRFRQLEKQIDKLELSLKILKYEYEEIQCDHKKPNGKDATKGRELDYFCTICGKSWD